MIDIFSKHKKTLLKNWKSLNNMVENYYPLLFLGIYLIFSKFISFIAFFSIDRKLVLPDGYKFILNSVSFFDKYIGFSIYFFIAILPFLLTIYILYIHKITFLKKLIIFYYTIVLSYLTFGPCLIALTVFLGELQISDEMVPELLNILLLTFLSLIILTFIELFKSKILIHENDNEVNSDKKHLIVMIIVPILLLFLMISLLNSPIKEAVDLGVSLEKLLIKNEILINNAIGRYKSLKGCYPQKLKELVKHSGKNNGFLSSIPYNPERDNFSWKLIKKNGQILYVTANHNGEFKKEKISKVIIFLRKYVVEILLLNILILFLPIYTLKKRYGKLSLMISTLFFFNFMFLFLFSNKISFDFLMNNSFSTKLFWRFVHDYLLR